MAKQAEDVKTIDMYDPDNCAQFENGACIGHVVEGRAFYWNVPEDANILRHLFGKTQGDPEKPIPTTISGSLNPKRRGRPPTGQAMTAAERQRRRREQERCAGVAAKLSTSGLIERMQGSKYKDFERKEAWEEFGKRMGWA